MNSNKSQANQWLLSLSALGIVFGDIGTSPLYAINQIFFGFEGMSTGPDIVLGCISIIIWALFFIISFKYMALVFRADNDGEGGVFALYGLLYRFRKSKFGIPTLLTLLILSAGLLFGDGMITPAISVLSAVEGMQFLDPNIKDSIIPITIIILSFLFYFQKKGTAKVGTIFGPILLVWFIVLALLGLKQIFLTPQILKALNPYYAFSFMYSAPLKVVFIVLGGAMLSITGGEALFADMGHFGKLSIRRAWFTVALPCLLLNYLGQGAFLLSGQHVSNKNLFFSMVPNALLFPIIILATMSTVIASQALIAGAFSITSQAVALGLFPRLKIQHTHEHHAGQIYVTFVNYILYAGCLLLVLNFKTSANLASAYGLAQSGVMLMTSISMLFISYFIWEWPKWKSIALFGFIAFIDLHFLTANTFKIIEGGFVPLTIGICIFYIMKTWRWGRKATFAAYSNIDTMTIGELVNFHRKEMSTFERNAILMVPKPIRSLDQNTPALLQLMINRHGLLPKNLFFVEVVHKKTPFIHENRCDVTVFEKDDEGLIASVAIKFGFLEEPNVEKVLEDMAQHHLIDLDPDPRHWIVHVSQENIIQSSKLKGFQSLRFRLFQLLRQISRPGHYYYGLGDEVQLSVEIIPVRI